MIRTRPALKQLFANGQLPDGNDFGDLIDSMVQQDQLGSAVTKLGDRIDALAQQVVALSIERDHLDRKLAMLADEVKALQNSEPFSPVGDAVQTPDWLGAAGRYGCYRDGQPMDSADSMVGDGVRADGKWHRIVSHLENGQAFEVLALARRLADPRAAVLTDALVLFGGAAWMDGTHGISQTHSIAWWRQRQRISLRWEHTYDGCYLSIRTNCDYGPGAMIRYHITRRW